MEPTLTANEARVIGCLIEKEVTTPEQYPLSLNALTAACNQKSNRDPVLNLDEGTVQATLDALTRKHLVVQKSGFGSRVPKYRQRFCNSEFASLQLSPQARGVICVLLLRGAQTPGELRTRTQRLCEFADVHEVEVLLEQLINRPEGALLARLPREPGRREARYVHLFSGEPPAQPDSQESAPADAYPAAGDDRLQRLEQSVAALQQQVEQLRQELARLSSAPQQEP